MSTETLERAFALADSGKLSNMTELRKASRREQLGQVDAHLAGGSIQKQLIARMIAAQARKSDGGS